MLFSMAWYGDDKAVGALVNMMKTSPPERQYLIAERLGEIGNKKSDEELCMLVDYSEDKKLKQVATISLGRRKAKLAAESLMDALTKGLELEASQALGMIGNKAAAKELKPLLLHKTPAVKLNAAFALARLGDKSGAAAARAMLGDADPVTAAKAAATLLAPQGQPRRRRLGLGVSEGRRSDRQVPRHQARRVRGDRREVSAGQAPVVFS